MYTEIKSTTFDEKSFEWLPNSMTDTHWRLTKTIDIFTHIRFEAVRPITTTTRGKKHRHQNPFIWWFVSLEHENTHTHTHSYIINVTRERVLSVVTAALRSVTATADRKTNFPLNKKSTCDSLFLSANGNRKKKTPEISKCCEERSVFNF